MSTITKHLSLSLFIFFFISNLYGQKPNAAIQDYASYTYISKVEEEYVSKVFSGKTKFSLEKIPFLKLDSFPNDSIHLFPDLTFGHYLLKSVTGHNVDLEIITVNDLAVEWIKNKNHLSFFIHRKSNASVAQNLEVFFNDEKLNFNTSTELYELNKYSNKGILKILDKGQVFYYQIEPDYSKTSFWRKLAYLPVIKQLHLFPRRLYRSVIQGYPIKNKRYKESKGYIVLSQPKYKPNDTLKLKAFVTDGKGKPKRKNLDVFLYNYYFNKKNVKIGEVSSSGGAYTFEFALNDSLEIDRNYDISLVNKKGREILEKTFKLEEYILDEAIYELGLSGNENKSFGKGNPIRIVITAKDINGLSLFDVKANLKLKLDEIYSSEQDIYVSNEIWNKEVNIDPIGETIITVHDSILPNIKGRLRLEAKFVNANNEIQTKQKILTIGDDLIILDHEVRNDSIFSNCIKDGLNQNAGKLIEIFEGKVKETKRFYHLYNSWQNSVNPLFQSNDFNVRDISFPFQEKINPAAKAYEVKCLNKTAIIKDELKANMDIFFFKKRDSIYFKIYNPFNREIRYTLYKNENKISQGLVLNIDTVWPTEYKDNLHLIYSYLDKGELVQKQKNAYTFENELEVDIDQASQIYPGQKVKTKIAVRDYQGNPVEGVDLTALSYNALFKENDLPSIPYFGSAEKGRRIKPGAYTKPNYRKEIGLKRKNNFKSLGIDSLRYYELKFPEDGILVTNEKVSDKLFGRLAVHLLSDFGYHQRHSNIYANDLLVYSPVFDNSMPVIQISNGVYDIKVLTDNYEYVFKNVEIQTGIRTDISLNISSPIAQQFRIDRAEKGKFSKTELRDIRSKTFSFWDFDKSINFISQNGRVIFSKENWKTRKDFGPILAGELFLHFKNGDVQKINFDSSLIYSIGKEEIVLIKKPSYDFRKQRNMKKGIPFEIEFVDFNERINRNNWDSSRFIKKHQIKVGKGNAKISIDLNGLDEPKVVRYLNLIEPNADYFIPGSSLTNKVIEGNYLVEFIYSDTLIYRSDTLYLKDNGVNYFVLDSSSFKKVNHLHKRLRGLSFYSLESDTTYTKIEEYKLPLSSNGSQIKGRVYSLLNDKPIDGARVYLTLENGQISNLNAETDSLGYYILNNIPNGNYGVLVDFIGHEIYYEEGIEIEESGTYFVKVKLRQEPEIRSSGNGGLNEWRPKLNINSHLFDSIGIVRGESDLATNLLSNSNYNISFDRANSSLASVQRSSVIIRAERSLKGVRRKRPRTLGAFATGRTVNPIFYNRLDDEELEEIVVSGYSYSKTLREEQIKPQISLDSRLDLGFPNPQLPLRENFRDHAIWEPNLRTDENGEAVFETIFPGNITKWKTAVLAMNDRKQSGIAQIETHALKEVFAQLNLPRFLIQGDESTAIGKISNYSKDARHLDVQLIQNENLIFQKDTLIENSIINKIPFSAIDLGELDFSYQFKEKDGLSDGEKRKFNVLRKGLEYFRGDIKRLKKDTNFTIFASDTLNNNVLSFYSNSLDVLREDVDYLVNYKHNCNEQIASRLRGLLVKRELLDKKDFRVDRQIRKEIKSLEKNMSDDFGWTWWGRGFSNPWISAYVIETFEKADKMGFNISYDVKRSVQQYLNNQYNRGSVSDQLRILKQMYSYKTANWIENELLKIDPEKLDLADRLIFIRLKQLVNKEFDLNYVLDKRKETVLGYSYWSDGNETWNKSDIQTTLLAHEIINEIDSLSGITSSIEEYVVQEKLKGRTFNTIERADLISLLLYKENKDQYGGEVKLSISGELERNIAHFPTSIELAELNQNINIDYSGNQEIIYSMQYSKWDEDPDIDDEIFNIQTTFQENGKEVDELKEGDFSEIVVGLDCKKEASYIMLEIPIPGGCVYADNSSERNPFEVHREYKKDKVIIYFKTLKTGNHELRVKLQNRYKGNYTLNPAKAELMYFPSKNGWNDCRSIQIK